MKLGWWFLPLVLTVVVFVIGWVGPEVEPIDVGGSHLLGLRFMPACMPFGVDALCGLDSMFFTVMFLFWFACFYWSK